MAQLDPGLVVKGGAEGGDDLLGAALDAEHVLVIAGGVTLTTERKPLGKTKSPEIMFTLFGGEFGSDSYIT